MVLRLRSGSADAGERAQEAARPASTWTSGMLKWPRNRSTTSLASPKRSRPVSTKTQVSWSPTASWRSRAATAESTPPERPQMTPAGAHLLADALRSPARGRRASTSRPCSPAMRNRKFCRRAGADARCGRPRGGTGRRRSGGPRRRWRRRARCRSGRRRDEARRHGRRPGRRGSSRRCELWPGARMPSNSGEGRSSADLGAAVLAPVRRARPGRRAGRTWSARRSRCPAPARPARTPPAGARGLSASWVEAGPPERMIAGRGEAARRTASPHGAGVDLAVDVLLAHAARDQLGVLRAEVEDQDALGHPPAFSAPAGSS